MQSSHRGGNAEGSCIEPDYGECREKIRACNTNKDDNNENSSNDNNAKAFQEYIVLAPVRRSSNGSLHELPLFSTGVLFRPQGLKDRPCGPQGSFHVRVLLSFQQPTFQQITEHPMKIVFS